MLPPEELVSLLTVVLSGTPKVWKSMNGKDSMG